MSIQVTGHLNSIYLGQSQETLAYLTSVLGALWCFEKSSHCEECLMRSYKLSKEEEPVPMSVYV